MIETFEIHITGDKSILTVAKPIKTIEVNLLKPDRSILRTEYMTSHVQHMASGFAGCKEYVNDIVKCLEFQGVNIVRVKIESPFYKHYVEQSLYIESHFEDDHFKLPTSQNPRHTMPVVTAREYEQRWFEPFMEHYLPSVIELCLFDTNVDEDKDWFDLY
jgi:hypothetical protein